MAARWTFLMALIGVFGLAGQSAARAEKPETLVLKYLKSIDARGYTITAVTDDFVGRAFPDVVFFEVRFRQYPLAVIVPKGLSASNLFYVQDDKVFVLVDPAGLRDFFFNELAPVQDDDEAEDAGLTWLRLTEAFSQDGFFV